MQKECTAQEGTSPGLEIKMDFENVAFFGYLPTMNISVPSRMVAGNQLEKSYCRTFCNSYCMTLKAPK
jgi:hypothetical protein